MQKLKDLLENVCEWPAKHENCECFLPHKFPVIRYSFLMATHMDTHVKIKLKLSSTVSTYILATMAESIYLARLAVCAYTYYYLVFQPNYQRTPIHLYQIQ